MRIERKSQRVNHGTGSKTIVWNFPELFDANGVDLGVSFLIQFEALNHLFCERPSDSFTQHRNFRCNIDAWFEIRFGFSSLINALVASTNTNNRVSIVQHLGTRKLRKDVNACVFTSLTQPANKLVD